MDPAGRVQRPGAWHAAAKTCETLGYPHRAGYAWWRHAQAQLDAGQPTAAAVAALRAATVPASLWLVLAGIAATATALIVAGG